jgi:hypothetical protein
MADILDQIRELMRQYVDQHSGERPNCVYISRQDEWEFIMVPMNKLPDDVAKKLLVEGPRKAFERLWGMKVIWDKEKTEVDKVKDER